MRVALCLFLGVLSAITGLTQNALPTLRPPYAPRPVDPYWDQQWYMDNRFTDGVRIGADLNVRGAWQQARGAGIVVAVVDNGVDLNHRDLAPNQAPDLHFDFQIGTPTGDVRPSALNPGTADPNHGTAGAGLVAAAQNGQGMVGIAPDAKFCSWIIYPTNATPGRSFVAPDKMAKMFQYQSNRVDVQLHNWVESISRQVNPQTEVESNAIGNAVTFGRNGKGVVMTRAAGNLFFDPNNFVYDLRNAGDDAFTSDPRAIAVGAARSDGRVTSYSERGACILVGGLSGDLTFGFANIFTTDRTGTEGYDVITFPSDPALSDYVFGSLGFTGTSAANPMMAGVCTLILSANPSLTYRDVQQVLIHSSRHIDLADPDLRRNGAGYLVNHRLGFGIPDAGEAVRVAAAWHNRPPMVRKVYASDVTTPLPIQDASLRVYVSDLFGLPVLTLSFIGFPTLGPQPDDPTPDLPLVYVGTAETNITQDLTGKGALIKRRQGGASFSTKIGNAAAAGAEFAIMYNDVDGVSTADGGLILMPLTDFVPIPTLFIDKPDGEALTNLIATQPLMRAQLRGEPTVARFNVTDSMLCEHVGVRVRTADTRRQDLRITLVSPMGTRSVLQALGTDETTGAMDWTFYSTQHFYELSSGLWTLEVTDVFEGVAGSLTGADLIINGVPIEDTDDDGLDDNWERAKFGNLAQSGLDDPDGDGSWNAREQILGTNPLVNETPFRMSASVLQTNAVRFAFPSVQGTNYVIRSSTDLNQPLQPITTIPGTFGETEVVSDTLDARRFIEAQKQ